MMCKSTYICPSEAGSPSMEHDLLYKYNAEPRYSFLYYN
ncbi:hypothetical protein T01_8601 [Trichinella spiralis]|uniref:Uncharacterized protein n=1 Tax=Trichinella spiralis TaxID=6334 RepID=A0A0V0YT23_TRISP|nr:hypothetical protein T01_8601 [Trichinella spiralis]